MNILKWNLLNVAGVVALSFGGCEQRTTQEDVQAARDNYEQQAEQASEALKDAQKIVKKEFRESEAARLKLKEKEAEFNSEQSRTAFLELQQKKFKSLQATAAELKVRQQGLEGDPQALLKKHLETVEAKLNKASENMEALKSAEVEEWPAKRDDVELALAQAAEEIEKAKLIQ